MPKQNLFKMVEIMQIPRYRENPKLPAGRRSPTGPGLKNPPERTANDNPYHKHGEVATAVSTRVKPEKASGSRLAFHPGRLFLLLGRQRTTVENDSNSCPAIRPRNSAKPNRARGPRQRLGRRRPLKPNPVLKDPVENRSPSFQSSEGQLGHLRRSEPVASNALP